MLVALSIRDIVLIDRLSVDFSSGMTVLTGETGAGKSILLDALSLALGGRGDSDLVRAGAAQGDVTAIFAPATGHPAQALLEESGIEGDGDLILRRVQGGDGRSRAFINDQPVSVNLLHRVGATLVEIHGQHDERALVDPAIHRALLDAFGGLQDDVRAVADSWRSLRLAEAEAATVRREVEAARADADYLKAAVEELSTLSPQPGEEDELADRRARLMRAERIAGDLSEAHDIVSGGGSPIPTLASLARRLERKAPEAGDLLDETVAALDRALVALDEAGAALEAAAALANADPGELERAEERLFALRAAARKHSVAVADLPALAESMSASLASIDAGDERLSQLDQAVTAARAAYGEVGRTLSERRKKAARRLEKAVVAELPALKLDRAKFTVDIACDPARISESGLDDVAFMIQTNPGTKPGPLMKVASGGELARFLLAIKVALADRGSAPTLVFDEIDTAVGGAVADAIGARLSRLSERVQVLAVTHAPQVAARAVSHLLVAKEPNRKAKTVRTDVTGLEGDRRREEIARMLAGATITEEARAAADRLILGAA